MSNPHNPLGRPYPRETLLAYARFCEERDLHLVSDEIYGMSVYDNHCEFKMISCILTASVQGCCSLH